MIVWWARLSDPRLSAQCQRRALFAVRDPDLISSSHLLLPTSLPPASSFLSCSRDPRRFSLCTWRHFRIPLYIPPLFFPRVVAVCPAAPPKPSSSGGAPLSDCSSSHFFFCLRTDPCSLGCNPSTSMLSTLLAPLGGLYFMLYRDGSLSSDEA